MQTSKWGPPLWKALHTMAYNYNPKLHNREAFKAQFTNILAETLPCIHCRNSYEQFINELSIDEYIDKPNGLPYWIYLVHNKVNDKLRKQGLNVKPNPSFESVCKKYNKWRADCSTKKNTPKTCSMPDFKDRCLAKNSNGKQCTRKRTHGCQKCTQHKKISKK
jgi:Erv1 / Alr family